MIVKATYTPAATSHNAGDSVGGAGTFQFYSSDYKGGDYVIIRTASLLIAGATIETTAWVLHLYNAAPTVVADDGAWDLSAAADLAKYIGKVDLAQVIDLGSSLYIENNAVNKPVLIPSGGALTGYLVNGSTLTPQAVAHTVTLYCEPVRS